MRVLPGRPISFHRGITVVHRPVKARGRGAKPRDGATESRPIQAGGTRPENEIRQPPEAGALPADSAIFPSVAQEQSRRLITGRPRSVTVRKDGSKALGGERLSEAQKGTVQLRREPPIRNGVVEYWGVGCGPQAQVVWCHYSITPTLHHHTLRACSRGEADHHATPRRSSPECESRREHHFAARKRLAPSCKRACRLQCRARLQMWPWCKQQHTSL